MAAILSRGRWVNGNSVEIYVYFVVNGLCDNGTTLYHHLINLPLDKMAAILVDYNFKCIFWNVYCRIPIQISLKLIPKGPIDNIPALV